MSLRGSAHLAALFAEGCPPLGSVSGGRRGGQGVGQPVSGCPASFSKKHLRVSDGMLL